MSSVQEVDFSKYLVRARRWLWLLVGCTVLAATITCVASLSLPRSYLSSITLMVGDDTVNVRPNLDDVNASQRLAAVYAGMIVHEGVLTATVNALGLPMPWYELARRVVVVRADGSQLIEIRATDTDPRRSKATVDELAHQLIQQSPTAEDAQQLDDRRQFVRQQLETLQGNIQAGETDLAQKQVLLKGESSARGVLDRQDEIKGLELNLTNWRASYATLLATNLTKSPNALTVIQPAYVPSDPVGPNVALNVLTGSLLGLMISLAAIFLLEYIKGARLDEPEDVTRSLGLPVLGTVGKMPKVRASFERLVAYYAPNTPIAEDYRHLRTHVQFACDPEEQVRLLVTSSAPQEGKSVTSANLAATFARAGKRTILIDADLSHPSLHELFDVSNQGGLTALFWGDVATEPEISGYHRPHDLVHVMRCRLEALLMPTDVPGLRLLPAGVSSDHDDAVEFPPTEDVCLMLEALRGLAEVVILDGPPVLAVAETVALAAMGPSVLLVVEVGQTRAAVARLMHDALIEAHAHVLGVVLNKAANRRTPYYEYRRPARQRSRQSSPLRVMRS